MGSLAAELAALTHSICNFADPASLLDLAMHIESRLQAMCGHQWQDAGRWGPRRQDCRQAQTRPATSLLLSAAARATPCRRAVQDACQRLARLGGKLAAALRRGGVSASTASIQLLLSCYVAYVCAAQPSERQPLSDAAVQAVYSCAFLPLDCGRLVLDARGASGAHGAMPGWQRGHEAALLHGQVDLLDGLVELAAGGAGDARRFAEQHAPPRALLAWLSAAIRAARMLHGPTLRGQGAACGAALRDLQPRNSSHHTSKAASPD